MLWIKFIENWTIFKIMKVNSRSTKVNSRATKVKYLSKNLIHRPIFG